MNIWQQQQQQDRISHLASTREWKEDTTAAAIGAGVGRPASTTEEDWDTAAASAVSGAGVCLPASKTDEKEHIAAVGAGVSRPASAKDWKGDTKAAAQEQELVAPSNQVQVLRIGD